MNNQLISYREYIHNSINKLVEYLQDEKNDDAEERIKVWKQLELFQDELAKDNVCPKGL